MNRSRSSARNKQNQKLDYLSLEARQLLAADILSIADQVSLTRDYLSSQPETSYLMEGDSDLRLVEVKHGLASTTTRFQQTIDGLPVYDAIITINQGRDGDFQRVHHALAFNEATLDFPEPISEIAVTMDSAAVAAMDLAGFTEAYVPARGELSWYVGDNGSVHQVWDMMVV